MLDNKKEESKKENEQILSKAKTIFFNKEFEDIKTKNNNNLTFTDFNKHILELSKEDQFDKIEENEAVNKQNGKENQEEDNQEFNLIFPDFYEIDLM